ncbi:hypothetical protein CLD22_11510 [Rubrivivax gelatinosus]|nr:hypothetical protein [Rubrivivax gelatinosus]
MASDPAASGFSLGAELRLNAWTGQASPADTMSAARVAAWAMQRQSGGSGLESAAAAPQEVAPWDWRHPKVGWGLVMVDDERLAPAARARADDAPAAIRRLWQSRPGAPVLRWNAGDGNEVLLRYDERGGVRRCSLVSDYGIGPDCIPRFLLIAASPAKLPWSFQYAANLRRYVARLDGPEDALGRYVDALLAGWAGSARDVRAPLVWSVDAGDDITWLMDQAISRRLFAAYAEDGDFTRRSGLFGDEATAARLVAELAARQPAVVVTTCHGMTGPLHDAALTREHLGVPVDPRRELLDLDALEAAWQPDGAVWYSHACCAAGSDTRSQYAGLFDAGGEVMRTLDGVAAACGACIAPLPLRLLGHARPLAAFIGHVEPTFNWTLRDPRTGQPLAHSVRQALYDGLFANGGGRPVGWALARVFDDAATLFALWAQAVRDFNKGLPGAIASALVNQVTALDRQHTVLLGCPTATLPALASSAP